MRHKKLLIVAAAAVAALAVTHHTSASCHIRGQLPDSYCTPGAVDTNVTQNNIHSTICVRGYTSTVRPPQSYTHKLKVQGIKDYGYKDTNLADYEEDHLVSLELGGSPTNPLNLWPEPGASPNAKDGVEAKLHAEVCSGKLNLAVAQSEIEIDWVNAK